MSSPLLSTWSLAPALLSFGLWIFHAAICLEAFAQEMPRKSWTTSKVQGTPEPPPPYALKRAYPKLSFQAPVSIHRFPKSEQDPQGRLLVMESNGKFWSFVDDDSTDHADLVMDFSNPLPKLSETSSEADLAKLGQGKNYGLSTYSMAFHPKFAENRFVYVCYIISNGEPNLDDGTHIARYRMRDSNPPTIDYDSEVTVLRCEGGGHNGCTLEFGPDGYLYISLGDARNPTPPDSIHTGQDISDLLSSILRIDVDRPSQSADGSKLNYTIPSDNPFVSLPKARGEVFAYGFRNPWRMSFDSQSGGLWVGDVGWEAFEMVYRVKSGGNYGWSIKEGPGDVVINQPMGPTPIAPADIALSHSDACSVTGGMVYHGTQHPKLRGKYVFGDWITRRFWASSFDDKSILSTDEIAYGEVKPIAFGVDSRDELLVLEYIEWNQAGGIYRFVENPAAATYTPGSFPTKLSETGLFRDTTTLAPHDGVVPYQINSTMWMEGADAQFHLAVPGEETVEISQSTKPTFDWFQSKVRFPKETVLAKTYSIGKGDQQRRIETQLSHYAGPNDWRFYSYKWLHDQSDAVLVPAAGESIKFDVPSSSLSRSTKTDELRWNFGARSQCRICHTPWSGDSMGLLEEQLRRPHDSTDSWRSLIKQGFLKNPANEPPAGDERFTSMAGIQEREACVERRARSYLHSNCAHCHQFGGVGSAEFDVRFEKSLADTKCVDGRAIKGTFDLDNAKLITPGDPLRSILYYRMAKSGSGRMPHIGSERVDTLGVSLIRQWIQGMPAEPVLRDSLSVVTSPANNISDTDRDEAIKTLLSSSAGTLLLANALSENAIPSYVLARVYALANASAETTREFIEPFLPSEMRVERLGSQFDASKLLEQSGNSERGRAMLLAGSAQCIQCHKIGQVGKEVGPSMDNLATKYKTKKEMLEHILDPSKVIAPEYRSSTFVTSDSESLVGRLLKRSKESVSILLPDGSQRELATSDIEQEKVNELSMMPTGLFATLTADQARDILEFLIEQTGK